LRSQINQPDLTFPRSPGIIRETCSFNFTFSSANPLQPLGQRSSEVGPLPRTMGLGSIHHHPEATDQQSLRGRANRADPEQQKSPGPDPSTGRPQCRHARRGRVGAWAVATILSRTASHWPCLRQGFVVFVSDAAVIATSARRASTTVKMPTTWVPCVTMAQPYL